MQKVNLHIISVMINSRDKLCAHQIIGRLHEYRWTVEIILRDFFISYLGRYIMEYACDEPRLVFAVLNFTGGLRHGGITLCKCLSSTNTYFYGDMMLILTGRFGNEYVLDPGMDVWNTLFWRVLPDSMAKINPRHVNAIISDAWFNDIDRIKCILYDLPEPGVVVKKDSDSYTSEWRAGEESDDSELEGAFDLFPDPDT